MEPHNNGAGHEGEPKCGGKTRAGGMCKNAAGFKTSHPGIGRCAFHGGATPTHERAATVELARRECARLGIPIEIDPGEALLHAVWECAGNVAAYRELVQQLALHPEPDKHVAGEDGDGHWERGEPGIYGRTYHVSGIPTGEAKPHVLVALYNAERDRLVDVSAAALRAGVEERVLRIAEADARTVHQALARALVAVGMGDRLEEVRAAFARALRADQALTPDAVLVGGLQ